MTPDQICDSDQGRPKTSVDIGDLAVDKPTDEDVSRIADCARGSKNIAAFGMSPPTPTKFFPSDDFSQGWNRSSAALENNTMLFYECQRSSVLHLLRTRQLLFDLERERSRALDIR